MYGIFNKQKIGIYKIKKRCYYIEVFKIKVYNDAVRCIYTSGVR